MAKQLAALVTSTKKERSAKVNGKTVDVYVNNLPREKARKALESNGQGFGAARLDFTPTKTGLMFHVGRWDGILYRVEQIYSVGKSGREDDDVKIQIDFLKVGKSKLPAEVRKLKDD